MIENYDIPGYIPPIRCHQCGARKNPEDVGIWVQFESDGRDRPNTVHKVWFHNEGDSDIWRKDNEANIVRIIE